jgi:hypothetical protein
MSCTQSEPLVESQPICPTVESFVLYTPAVSQNSTESQDSILLSSQEEDSFSEPNYKRSSTIAGPLDDFKEFHPSIVHYCQCFTILTGNRHKITSTMTAIQVYMTEGNDYRLLSESEEIFPIYVLLKSNNAIAILVNKVDPGQHLLTYIGKKFKVQSGKGQSDTSIKRMSVTKAVISKYSGFVINPSVKDAQIIMLGSFQRQPITHTATSTKPPLSTKEALLEEQLSQPLLEQNSTVKPNQINLQLINMAAKKMAIIERKKKKKLKAGRNKKDGETSKTNKQFQLRIVLREKGGKKRKRPDLEKTTTKN